MVTGIHPQAGHSSRDEKSLTIDGVVGPVVAATQLATLGLPTQRSQLPRRPASDPAHDQQHFEQGKPRRTHVFSFSLVNHIAASG
jgi:hypothetical protein